MPDFNFQINPGKSISEKFLEIGITDFISASSFVRQLPYRRNTDKYDLMKIFRENCGTCSTKHALLKELANENSIPGIRLMLGIYRMNEQNTPDIGNTLLKYKMDFIPEAHNYLRIENAIADYTFEKTVTENFERELLTEMEITPQQIGEFKINFHKKFLLNWLGENKSVNLSPVELWSIREECIEKLSETR